MKKTFKLLNCHPKKTRKNKTCYDTSTLVILKNKWNETHPDKIEWNDLSLNTCSDAIKILEKNQHEIIWFYLSSNPSAIDCHSAVGPP